MDPMQALGLSSTPLFVGYQPFAIDTSSRDRTNELRMKLLMDLGERDRKLREDVRGLQVPELEGLPNDTSRASEQALSVKKQMISMLAKDPSASSFEVLQSPEFQALRDQWDAAVGPAVRAKLKYRLESEKRGAEVYTKRAQAGDPINEQYAVVNGAFMHDPKTGRPLTIQESREILTQRPEGDYVSAYKDLDIASLSNVVTPLGLAEWSGTRFKESGATEWKQGSPTNLTADEVASLDPVLQASYYFDRTRGGADNLKQLNSAVSASLQTMGPDQRRAIVQMYMDTEHFAKNVDKYRDKSGRLDYSKVENGAFGDNGYRKFKKGKAEGGMTFANSWMISEMGRFKNSSWFDDLRAVAAKGTTQGGGDDEETRKANFTSINLSPVESVQMVGDEIRPAGKAKGTTSQFPVADSKGNLGYTGHVVEAGGFSHISMALASSLRPTGSDQTSPNYVEMGSSNLVRASEVVRANPQAGLPLSYFGSQQIIGSELPISINTNEQSAGFLDRVKVVSVSGNQQGVSLVTYPKTATDRNFVEVVRDGETQAGPASINAEMGIGMKAILAIPKSDAASIGIYVPDVNETSTDVGSGDKMIKSYFNHLRVAGTTSPVDNKGASTAFTRETQNPYMKRNDGFSRQGTFKGKQVKLDAAVGLLEDYVGKDGAPLIYEDGDYIFIKAYTGLNETAVYDRDARAKSEEEWRRHQGPNYSQQADALRLQLLDQSVTP